MRRLPIYFSPVNKHLTNLLKFLLFLGIGVGILWFFYEKQNAAFQEQCKLDGVAAAQCSLIDKLVSDFKSLNFFWIGMTLLAFSVSNLSRAARWNMLLKPLGYRPKIWNSFFAVNISYLTNLWLSRAGEIVRGTALAKTEKMSLGKVMGTIIVDRLLDLFTLGLIVAFSFLVEFDTLWGYLKKNMQSGGSKNSTGMWTIPLMGLILTVFIVACAVLYFYRQRLTASPPAQKAWAVALRFWEGIKTLKQVDRPGLFIFHSVVIWLMYYMMTYLCFFAFAPTAHLSPMAALTVFVFGTFGIVIPSPGGMGTYHVLATAALVVHGVNSADAFSFANIMFFTIQIFYNIVVGVASIILLTVLNKKSPHLDAEDYLEPELAENPTTENAR